MRLFPIISNRQSFKPLYFPGVSHDGTAEEVLEVTGKAVQAQQCADLGPMADFMHDDVSDDFSRCGVHHKLQNLKFPRYIPLCCRKSLHKFFEFLAALLTELKQSFDLVVWDGSRIS